MSQREDGQPDDHVDRVLAQWRRARPDLDFTPVAVVARLGRAVEYIDAGRDALLAAHGLNRALWDVLASLRREEPPHRLSPTQLYRGLMRTSGAMTNRLAALERAGLVDRVPDAADGRSTLVALTPRGKDLVDEIAPAYLDNERRLLAALDPDDQARLAATLRKLLLAFEHEDEPAAGARRGSRHSDGR
jgi:DNA-binding MarR family transcriptional regulator